MAVYYDGAPVGLGDARLGATCCRNTILLAERVHLIYMCFYGVYIELQLLLFRAFFVHIHLHYIAKHSIYTFLILTF